MRWTVELQEDPETGDLILELPQEILTLWGCKEGDVINWSKNNDGSWTISPSKQLPLDF